MDIAAYCRVSTDKTDQLNSLEAQKQFFLEYTQTHGHHLVDLYADEGISGTKIRNRREFLRLMGDAEQGRFQMVVVKDISRFARNTVDFLQSIRALKALQIETVFLTSNQTVLGNSEFVLTIFGALAQEESANTSKRVKFGKRINAEKGRVPNLVYGYDKTPGEYFHMEVNPREAETVRQIYRWYVQDGLGASRIADLLNGQGERTKRGCHWSQNGVSRILANPLYTGQVVNGKQEVVDFLTGTRKKLQPEQWLVAENPALQIVDPQMFRQAQQLRQQRSEAYHSKKERSSNRHLFSTLIKCERCGYSYRRFVRTYQNTYVRWVCSRRNGSGASSCPNKTAVEEEALAGELNRYFCGILSGRSRALEEVQRRFLTGFRQQSAGKETGQITARQRQLALARERYLELYADGLMQKPELESKLAGLSREQEKLEGQLQQLQKYRQSEEELLCWIQEAFPDLESFARVEHLNNIQLKRIVEKILVSPEGIDVYLRQLDSRAVPVGDIHT